MKISGDQSSLDQKSFRFGTTTLFIILSVLWLYYQKYSAWPLLHPHTKSIPFDFVLFPFFFSFPGKISFIANINTEGFAKLSKQMWTNN